MIIKREKETSHRKLPQKSLNKPGIKVGMEIFRLLVNMSFGSSVFVRCHVHFLLHIHFCKSSYFVYSILYISSQFICKGSGKMYTSNECKLHGETVQ